jgi:hypothetical protein
MAAAKLRQRCTADVLLGAWTPRGFMPPCRVMVQAPSTARAPGSRRAGLKGWPTAGVVCFASFLWLCAVPASAGACFYASSCKGPKIGVMLQVAVALFVVIVVGGLIWWRIGRPGKTTRFLLWLENRRVRRAARRK